MTGYLGMELPASWRGFAVNSPWRMKVGLEIDPDSDAQINQLQSMVSGGLKIATNKWTSPIHGIDEKYAPVRTVYRKSGIWPAVYDPDNNGIQLPIPGEIWADPENDAHIVLYYPNLNIAWEFWSWEKSGTDYKAGMVGKWDVKGLGYNVWPENKMNGAVAAKCPIIGGLIRYEEVIAGDVQHAGLMVVPGIITSKDICNPVASNTDGTRDGNQFLREGQRICLDPAYDDSVLNVETRRLCRMLKQYGAYIMDRGSDWHIKCQNYGDDRWKQFTIQINQVPWSAWRIAKGSVIKL